MTTVRTFLRGIAQKTVWSDYNLRKIPPRYQLIYTLLLPWTYFIVGLYGFLSVGVPITSIDLVFGTIYGDLWSIGLTSAGILSFIGLAFYKRLIWVETVGTIFMVTLMSLYTGAIFIAASSHVENFRYLSLLLVLVVLPMPSWRVYDIVRELRPPRHVS